MPARYVGAGPTTHRGPLPEYENESIFDWIRRQNRPVKPAAKKSPTQTTFEAAIAEMVQQKKKDATGGNRSRPTDPKGI